MILSQPRDNSEYIEQLHHQHETIEQRSSPINNMLLIAKTEKELYDGQSTPVDVQALITKKMSYYELVVEERGISFKKSGTL